MNRLENFYPLKTRNQLEIDYLLYGNCWFYIDNKGVVHRVDPNEVNVTNENKRIRHRGRRFYTN